MFKSLFDAILHEKKKTRRWLANELCISEQTLNGKFFRNSFGVDDVFEIAEILDIEAALLKKEYLIQKKRIKEDPKTKDTTELKLDEQSIQRIAHSQENNVVKHKFEDFATEEDKKIVREASEVNVSDEELFE